MKQKNEKRYSCFLLVTVLLLLASSACLTLWARQELLQDGIIPQTKAETAAFRTEMLAANVWETRHYNSVVVVNAENGYFAVRGRKNQITDSENWKIVDRDGHLIKDLEPYSVRSVVPCTCENYAFAFAGKRNSRVLIDRKTLMLSDTGCDEIALHSSGQYYLVYDMDDPVIDQKEVRTPDGDVLLRTDGVLKLTSETGFAIENPDSKAGDSRLIHLDTGVTVYTAPEGCSIWDRNMGYIVLQSSMDDAESGGTVGVRYLLDEVFQIALNGQLFSDVYFSDRFIYGSAYPDARLDSRKPQFTLDGCRNEIALVYTLAGEPVFRGARNDSFHGIYENLAVIQRTVTDGEGKRKRQYLYVDLNERGNGR
ncbi:MAG: hypothetical protein ACI4WY_01845 [Anaerovoracaceae bacterium]